MIVVSAISSMNSFRSTSEHLKCPPFPREPTPRSCWKQVNKDGQAVRTQSAWQNFSLLLLYSNLSLKFSFKLIATMLLPIWRFLCTLFPLLTSLLPTMVANIVINDATTQKMFNFKFHAVLCTGVYSLKQKLFLTFTCLYNSRSLLQC